jgi:hypothetical protein
VPSSRGSPIYPSVHTSGSTGPHSYTGTTMASWAYPRGSFVPSPRWQGASNYAPMIVPQGLVQVPSWNSYPVRSSHLIVRQHNEFSLSRDMFSVFILFGL